MKSINFKSIVPAIPFLFYAIAIAVGFNWQIDSGALYQVNCFNTNLCTQVDDKN